MELQTNPYLIWQALPGLILLGVGFYIQSRPVKKRESRAFALLMFAGSLWAFANAVQLITPDMGWQRFWNLATYLGIMVVPTAWLLLSVKLTGVMREQIEKIEKYLWIPPAFFYLVLLTNGFHHLFVKSFAAVTAGGYAALENNYGTFFYFHTAYSYLLIVLGVGIMGFSLATKFKKYGSQAYGLIVGVLAPLIGNIYFLFGSPPPGFPDPTPIIFTVTGVAFAWAIFGGHILEVVPLAHDAIVRELSTGILILDAQKNIRDINPAALAMLGLSAGTYLQVPLTEALKENPSLAEKISATLENHANFNAVIPQTGCNLAALVSRIEDRLGNFSGWLIQFNDISEKTLVEKNLTTAREKLEAVLDTLQDGYFEANPKGVLTYANKAFVQGLGFSSRDEIYGQDFRAFTDEKSVRVIFEKFKLLYETRQPLEPFEYHYRTRSGDLRVGETTVSPIMEGDQIVGTRGLIRDATARVNAEKEILKQKDTLDSLLQQSPIAMVISDRENKITLVNPAFEKLFGFSSAESVGGRLEDFLRPPEVSTRRAEETSTASLSKSATYVRQRKAKDGTILDVEIFTTPFHVGGERFGYLVFYNDITGRLKIQDDLAKSQSSYVAVLETLPDPYFEIDPTGRLTYVNRALCDAAQYSRDELIGKHFRIAASRTSVRETMAKFEEMFRTGEPIPPFEFTYRRKDKQEFESEMVVSPIMEDGKAIGARGVIRDITLRVQAEEARYMQLMSSSQRLITLRVEAEEILRQAKEAAESRADELSAINRVAVTVGQSLNLEDILQSVCVELTRIFEIRNAGIGILTADKNGLEIVAFHAINPEESDIVGMILPFESNQSSRDVIEKRKTIVLQDVQNDPRSASMASISRERGTKAIMIVPLMARGRAIGTIGMPAKDPEHVFTNNEIELAETIASQIATAVDNARLYKKTELALDVAERDLEIGRQIQFGFFPERLPDLPGWEIAAHFHAARQVAGDFYDVFKFKNSSFTAFIIADVCDKGVGAALFMVLFRSLLRAFSERQINSENIREQLLDIIVKTNNFIAEYHGRSNMFATIFFGVLDPDDGVLYYINGGHEPPVILDKDGRISRRLNPTGPAVGMFPEMDFAVAETPIDRGDMLMGFTDGATDAKDAQGKIFSEERLLARVATPWTSAFSMLFELNGELKKYIGEQNQFDDITLVSFRRKPEREDVVQHAICRPAQLEILSELREFIETVGAYNGLNHDDVFAFKLAVDEACSNIVNYGYAGEKPGFLSLFFSVKEGVASLVIRDDGQYFSNEQARVPDIDADWDKREMGGFGIYFINELMDNVAYNRENDVNVLTLQKKLK